MEPFLKQLTPEAGKEIIKVCSKMAYLKIRRHLKKKNKRESSSSSSSSYSDSSSSSNSSQYTSDEDMFEDKKKRKKKTPNQSFSNTTVRNRKWSRSITFVGQFTIGQLLMSYFSMCSLSIFLKKKYFKLVNFNSEHMNLFNVYFISNH